MNERTVQEREGLEWNDRGGALACAFAWVWRIELLEERILEVSPTFNVDAAPSIAVQGA